MITEGSDCDKREVTVQVTVKLMKTKKFVKGIDDSLESFELFYKL